MLILLWSVQGGVTILGFRQTSMSNSILKLRRPTGRPNFDMELPITVGRNPNIVHSPRHWDNFPRCGLAKLT